MSSNIQEGITAHQNVHNQLELTDWLSNAIDSLGQLQMGNMDAAFGSFPPMGKIDMANMFLDQYVNSLTLDPASAPLTSATHMTRYGRKVFLGGLPIGISSEEILANFERYGPARIDWPHKAFHENIPPAGYAFIIFQNSLSVAHLVKKCHYLDYKYQYGIRRIDGLKANIEVKPWDMENNEKILAKDWQQYARLSVFIGGLPRTITSGELATLLEEAVGDVAYVGIEIDQHTEYPKGAAQIIFSSKESYLRAIAMQEITVLSGGTERVSEIKPFLHSSMPCETCNSHLAISFCAEIRCLKYFCDRCWRAKHSTPGMATHKPMQKGRYFSSNKVNSKVPRLDFSRSHSSRFHSSNSSSIESLYNQQGSLFNNVGMDQRHRRFHNSLETKYPFGIFSPSALSPPFTPFSNDTVFDFKKH